MMLVVMTGLPCTGKSVIAAAVARVLPAALIAADPIDTALLGSGVQPDQRPDIIGYEIMKVLADQQLAGGLSAVIDAVNPFQFVREAYADIALRHDSPIAFITATCSDMVMHRQRVDRRHDDGLKDIDWAGVERQIAYYEPHEGESLLVDAVDPLDANIAKAIAYLRLDAA